MKSSSEKSSTTTPSTTHTSSSQPFFGKAGGGSFFEPTTTLPFVQAKMTVNKPGDKFEQEADRTADRVMRMPKPEEQIQKTALKEEKIQKKEEDKIQKAESKEEKLQKSAAKEEKIQRRGDGTPAVSSSTQSAIRNKTTGGQPMSTDVRSFMEPRFGADFGNVRIHNDAESASLSNQLSARAFTYQNHIFFSRDQYQPGTSEGRHLLAHELTHTVQQGAAIQRQPTAISTTATPPPIQRLGVQDALDYFADKAYNIPGFRLLTIVLGFNPINRQTASRSAANILRGLVELIPGGHLITQALDNHGVFNKAGAWVEQKISTLGDIGSEIVNGLKQFLDSLGWSDIFDLGGVWERAKRIFTGPIGRLIDFGVSVATEILKMVKDAVLKPLAAMAQGTRGYDLLKAILGQDPITGEAVPRNADTLIGGFMKLIGQEEIWQNLKKGNAVARAWAWFQGALAGLLGFARSIPAKIIETLQSLTFQDIVTVAGAFVKIGKAFVNIATEFLSWGLNQVISLLEILFSVVAPGAVPYIAKAKAAFHTIIKDPIGFVRNLVNAGKLGFQQFANNIGTHLKNALIKWLTGPLGEAGVYIPQSFSLMEIVKLVLSVLGLTWQNIRGKLLKIIPEPVLVVLEKTAGILVTLVKDGPAAAWEQIKAELTELKDQLISQVTEMVTSQIVKAAVTKLVSMLNPAGAVIQAIMAIYNTITFFIEKINQIAATVGAFIDSISAIASGQIGNAAKKVETTMANTLVVIIGFLAKFAGLGGIPDKLVGIVKKIRQPIDKGLDKIVAWLGKMLEKMKTAIKNLFFKPKTFSVGGESHRLYAEGDNVMMASSPARLDKALNRFRNKDPKPSASTLALISQADTKGNQLQKNLDKKDDTLIPQNETLSNDIVALVVKIMYETGGAKKKTMPKAVVTFASKGDKVEFDRQINMQQVTLNNMKVGAWQQNRARFVAFGRDHKNDKESTRQTALSQSLMNNPIDAVNYLKNKNLLTNNDLNLINSILSSNTITDKKAALAPISKSILASYGSKKLAVLHTVDQVAGGSATTYGDKEGIFGSTSVNTEIGRQWKDKISIVDKEAVDVEADANVNVELKS